MSIRWKAVHKFYRQSWSIRFKPFIKIYTKGTIVEAIPGSPGILCFKTKKRAIEFVKQHSDSLHYYEIIKVKTIGKGKIVRKLLSQHNELTFLTLLKLLEDDCIPDEFVFQAPNGTYGYPSVEVLT